MTILIGTIGFLLIYLGFAWCTAQCLRDNRRRQTAPVRHFMERDRG